MQKVLIPLKSNTWPYFCSFGVVMTGLINDMNTREYLLIYTRTSTTRIKLSTSTSSYSTRTTGNLRPRYAQLSIKLTDYKLKYKPTVSSRQ